MRRDLIKIAVGDPVRPPGAARDTTVTRINNGISGALEGPSSYLMKSPPKQIRDDESRELVERYITQNSTKKAKAAAKA